jgi:hypothetical protein
MVLLLDDTEGRLLLMAGNNYTSNRKQYSSHKEAEKKTQVGNSTVGDDILSSSES